MNREKYVNDKSYREGYQDGHKEGSNASMTSFITAFKALKKQIDDFEQMLNEIEKVK